ncbi:ion transporter [Helicobacter sp. MIT 05-5293]|nr:ion transporter [Helicobacter sp. MIT 05-5293]
MKLSLFLESRLWTSFIIGVILINSIALGLDTIDIIHRQFNNTLFIIDNVCLVIFVIELSLRIITYKKNFFIGSNEWGWNWFDLIIVLISIFANAGFSIVRAVRIVKIFRLLSAIPAMRIISMAMLHTIPAMLSVVVLLTIFYYIYGVLCVNLFGDTFPQWFGNLGKSFYTLFQIMTLESWSMGIVRPIMEVYPYAWIVFISFICITNFIVLNLIVGVAVESIAEIKKNLPK